ncbi:MAG: response regulator [Cellvibrionales bacterium]|nr:response regulator [Cellvibrionales bacterium]
MRVLIVDDSFLMRRIIRNIIEKDNSLEVVGEAPDGIVALEKVAELSPDIILLDIEMPNMDGIEFLRRAKLVTSAKVIIISSVARIDSKEAREVLELGAVDIIPKPSGVLSIDFEEQKSLELLDAIHKCL